MNIKNPDDQNWMRKKWPKFGFRALQRPPIRPNTPEMDSNQSRAVRWSISGFLDPFGMMASGGSEANNFATG